MAESKNNRPLTGAIQPWVHGVYAPARWRPLIGESVPSWHSEGKNKLQIICKMKSEIQTNGNFYKGNRPVWATRWTSKQME